MTSPSLSLSLPLLLFLLLPSLITPQPCSTINQNGGCSITCPCPITNDCCSQYGYCGTTQQFCGPGCLSGPCNSPPPVPSPVPPPTPFSSGGVFFSPYKDVGINMNWNDYVISTMVTGVREPVVDVIPFGEGLTWAFATGKCGSETWAAISGPTLASANVDMFDSKGINYILSTGGAAGSFTCSSTSGMKAFLDRYNSSHLVGVDFDIENYLTSSQINDLVASVKGVQQYYPDLRYSFTLATFAASNGSYACLNSLGSQVVSAIKSQQLTNYYINLMTMDYGGPSSAYCVVGSNGKKNY